MLHGSTKEDKTTGSKKHVAKHSTAIHPELPLILVRKMFSLADMYYGYSSKELQLLRHKTAEKYQLLSLESKDSEFIPNTQAALLSKLDYEQERIKQFNDAIQKLDQKNIPYPIKTNKVAEIISGAKAIITQYSTELLQNLEIAGYDTAYKRGEIPTLGRDFWGTSQATYFKYAVTITYAHLSDQSLAEIPGLETGQDSWINYSVNAFLSPLYIGFDSTPYKGCSFIFTDPKTSKHSFLSFHNFYAFGGTRECDHASELFPEAPTDCSEVISRVMGMEEKNFTTIDPYMAALACSDKTSSTRVNEWKSTSIAEKLSKTVEVIPAGGRVREGDIYSFRWVSSESADSKSRVRQSGHMAIVITPVAEGQEVLTIGCARDIERNIEGMGIMAFQARSGEEPTQDSQPAFRREVTYLRLRPPVIREKYRLKPWQAEFLVRTYQNALDIQLLTPEFSIRSIRPEDAEEYIKVFGDSLVMEKFATGVRYPAEKTKSRMATWLNRLKTINDQGSSRAPDPMTAYTIRDRTTNEFIAVFVIGHGERYDESEVAYVSPHVQWGKKKGSQFADAMFNVLIPNLMLRGIRQTPLTRVVATAHVGNIPSIAMLKASGFKVEKTTQKFGFTRFEFSIFANTLKRRFQKQYDDERDREKAEEAAQIIGRDVSVKINKMAYSMFGRSTNTARELLKSPAKMQFR